MGKKKGSAKEKTVDTNDWAKQMVEEFLQIAKKKEKLLDEMLAKSGEFSVEQWIKVWIHAPAAHYKLKVLNVIESRSSELKAEHRSGLNTMCRIWYNHNDGVRDRIRNLMMKLRTPSEKAA